MNDTPVALIVIAMTYIIMAIVNVYGTTMELKHLLIATLFVIITTVIQKILSNQ